MTTAAPRAEGAAAATSAAELRAHGVRVAALAADIGRAMGLAPRDLDALRIGARRHDAGKAGLPSGLFAKPGPLTDREWRAVRIHPRLGSEIARALGLPRKARLAIRHHHERWNGSGYPDGLRGTAIPLLARIIAVADAYDAMTHDRPYRARLTHAAAMRELKRHAGTQFDPSVVAALAKAVGDRRRAG